MSREIRISHWSCCRCVSQQRVSNVSPP